MKEIIDLWKEKNINECIMSFDCGGDSMNETDFDLYDKEGKLVTCPEIIDYFEDKVYDNVEFYENSDGHYQGESGTVTITLNDEEDGFYYMKDAMSDYSEEFRGITDVELSQDELDFVKKYARIILGGENEQRIVYQRDCILNTEAVRVQEDLLQKIHDTAHSYVNPNVEGEPGEWLRYSTAINGDEVLTLDGSILKFEVNQNYYVTRPSED